MEVWATWFTIVLQFSLSSLPLSWDPVMKPTCLSGTAEFCKKFSEHYRASCDAEKVPFSMVITIIMVNHSQIFENNRIFNLCQPTTSQSILITVIIFDWNPAIRWQTPLSIRLWRFLDEFFPTKIFWSCSWRRTKLMVQTTPSTTTQNCNWWCPKHDQTRTFTGCSMQCILQQNQNCRHLDGNWKLLKSQVMSYVFFKLKLITTAVTEISTPRYDGWKNGHLSPELLTWRGLHNLLHGKGTCELFCQSLEFKEYLFSKTVPFLSSKFVVHFTLRKPSKTWLRSYGWDDAIVAEMKEVSDSHKLYREILGWTQVSFH